MSNLERIFNAYKKELVILETIKTGPVSDIFLCKYKEKKAVIRIDKTWSVQMKFDRSTEVEIINKLQPIKFTPKILHHDVEKKILIWEYIEGKEVFLKSENKKNLLELLGQTIKKLHITEVPKNTKNIFLNSIEFYKTNLLKYSNNKFLDRGFSIFDRLSDNSNEYVLSHNDLNKSNIILNQNLYFLDWEYAGPNDPYFDLASISMSLELNDDDINYLWKGYSGNKSLLDREKLQNWSIFSIFLDYMWCLTVADLSKITNKELQIRALENKLANFL